MEFTIKFIEELIDELNDNIPPVIYEDADCGPMCFGFAYNGIAVAVTFMEITLWDSENDGREFNEDLDDYEPLKDYVLRQFNTYVKNLNIFYQAYATKV